MGKTLVQFARERGDESVQRRLDELAAPLDFYGGGNPLDDVEWTPSRGEHVYKLTTSMPPVPAGWPVECDE